ncbi:MAG: hypothetical protein HPY46_06690 [Candidatus Aminicenantes bacterium]|uniref:Uncharacterized protein n=1 Tax=Candidatus Saccharicenans subterraneus TaxID=2508984 RepID=A0A3E2BQ82_9BACT|nr:hypothetical protein [Candidatus Aminicenantes bacterium]RFT16786.1 MAG: hypothetical protein OP8BY_1399 [Candidatus Saccharicenans subterraneum]
MLKSAIRTSIIIFLCLCLALPASSQLNKLKDKIKLPVKTPQVPDLDKLFQEEPPVSTSLDDAIYDVRFLDAYNPGKGAPVTFLPLTPQAAVPLLPGLWEGIFQSYCLRAGTYGPGEGDGYAYAPLKGKQAEIVANVLKNSVYHPEIKQEDVQLLLWAIIARSKPSECNKEIQKAARVLLTSKEYDRLNGGAIGKIPQPVLNAALEKLPPLARDVFHAEARLREMLVSPVLAPYHEVERVAVRVGEVLPPPDSRGISRGRWSYDPDGYFIRYFPYDYTTTRIQLYYPEDFTLETDENGLITAISDRQGTKINIVYDPNTEPLLFAGYEGVAGLAFKELIFTRAEAGGAVKTSSIKNTGWVLAGVPAGGGKPAGPAGPRFADASDRYKLAVHHRDEVLDLIKKPAKVNPDLKNLPDSAAWSVIYLGNFCEAIRQAVQAAVNPEGGQLEEPESSLASLPYRAWMKGLALLANGEIEGLEAQDQNDSRPLNLAAASTAHSGPLAINQDQTFPALEELNTGGGDVFDEYYFEGPGKNLVYIQKAAPSRQLPKFVWVKKPAPKWEKETRPRKLGPSGLPLYQPDKKVAQPGNTGKQRLGQSGRKSGSDSGRQAAENTRKMINWFSRGTSAGSFVIGKAVGPGAATPYGIPKAVATYTIGRTVGLWGECIDAISMDPPRSDYTVLARTEPGTFTPVRAEGGVTRARADAVNALLAAAVDLTAKMRAARFSVERYSGAMLAGDEEWARRQLENAIKYERESGLAMLVVADRLEALTGLAQAEKIPDFEITPQIVEAYRNSLRQQGFGPEELEVCRALNLTAAEIEEMRAEILSGRELEGAASLYESTRELARALREFSRLLVALPVF